MAQGRCDNSTFTFNSRNVPTVIFLCIFAPIEFERPRSRAAFMIDDDLTCDSLVLVTVGDDVHTVGIGDACPAPHVLHH